MSLVRTLRKHGSLIALALGLSVSSSASAAVLLSETFTGATFHDGLTINLSNASTADATATHSLNPNSMTSILSPTAPLRKPNSLTTKRKTKCCHIRTTCSPLCQNPRAK